MESARNAIPITDADLDALKDRAEKHITRINGTTDLEQILKKLAPEETYRTLPIELDLVYTIRHAVCLYIWLSQWLFAHTGQAEEAAKSEVPTESILKKQRFSSAYALFAMASQVVIDCDSLLKGKDPQKLATIKPVYKFEPGRNFSQDLQILLSYYTDTLGADNGNGVSIIKNANDIVSVTRDFWASVAERGVVEAKKADAQIQNVVVNCVFRNNDFTIAGFEIENGEPKSVVTFVPVQPEEIVGNTEAVIMLLRLMDRISLYNESAHKNPLCEVGGIYESVLVDGPPGTGKTTLQRMAMTRLANRAQQVGMAYNFVSLDASKLKTEWYGKSGKQLAEQISIVLNPAALSLMLIDDIDLLLANRDDPGSGGADKDLLKGLMDFFSGIGTNYNGNYTSIAATNKPTGFDDALRQRFVYRVLVLGAESWQDYADLVALQLRKPIKLGLAKVGQRDYRPLSRTRSKTLIKSQASSSRGSIAWEDIGHYIEELHSKNPAFTARTVKNAMDVVVAKAGDFEVPEEFYSKPDVFRDKPFEEQVKIVQSLFGEISAQAIMDSLTDQFESECRYSQAKYVNNR